MKGFYAKRYCSHCGGTFTVNHDGLISHHYEPVNMGRSWAAKRLRHPCAGWKQKGLKHHPPKERP